MPGPKIEPPPTEPELEAARRTVEAMGDPEIALAYNAWMHIRRLNLMSRETLRSLLALLNTEKDPIAAGLKGDALIKSALALSMATGIQIGRMRERAEQQPGVTGVIVQ